MISGCQLPESEDEFFASMKMYFPNVYDIKMLIKDKEHLKGSLSRIAECLQVRRIGPNHQAGSDSLITSAVWYKLIKILPDDEVKNFLKDENNLIWGLGKATKGLKCGAEGGKFGDLFFYAPPPQTSKHRNVENLTKEQQPAANYQQTPPTNYYQTPAFDYNRGQQQP